MALPSASTSDIWEHRLDVLYRAILPYLLLVASTLLAVLAAHQSPGFVLGTLALVGLAALWEAWLIASQPAWTRRPALVIIYYLGLLALIAVLLTRSPWFGLLAFTGYVRAFSLFPIRWAVVGSIASAVLAATAQRGGLPHGLPALTMADVSSYVIVIVFNASLAGAFTYIGARTSEQNKRRGEAIAELAEANRKLAAMLEENAALHVRLLTQAREAGILEERQRMAREIHDTLAQGFIGIIAQLEAAKLARQQPEQWQFHLEQAQMLARESLTEARRSVQALQPKPLEDSRLPEAIADLARRWATTAGVTTHLETTGEPRPLRPEIEVTLFRVAQEALTNVAKHARASRVGITISYMDDVVLLDVRDDGTGFTPASPLSNGRTDPPGHRFGLRAMEQRLRQVGGRLEIESAPGSGTAISASVPGIWAEGGT